MSATKPASRLRVTEQVPQAVALAFLKCDPRENVFLISRIHKSGMGDSRSPAHGRFLGAYDNDQSLRGLCFVGNTGALVLSVDEAWVAAEFVDPLVEAGYAFTLMLSEFDAGRAFLTRYKKRTGRRSSLDRKQIFYSIDSRTLVKRFAKEIDMEQASLDSIDELTDLACEMVTEDLKLELRDVDRRQYRLRMTEKVMEGRAYLCRNKQGQPLFKCDLSVIGTDGGLMEGVFTPKDLRNQGLASRAMWTICRELVARQKIPFIALHVDEKNTAARKVYERVGFQELRTYRLTIFSPVA
ncbi:MAG: putative GNAT family acetyltransferase [Pseudohongiellaceae bacterium]|jgi:predicted GNAT family acetyltransferase